jgi:predicted nucleic acid-binding protein
LSPNSEIITININIIFSFFFFFKTKQTIKRTTLQDDQLLSSSQGCLIEMERKMERKEKRFYMEEETMAERALR